MPDLNDLHFFAAVVANEGFSAASRVLGVPKSRISRRIAALETQLGVRLLERSSRRFRVTEVGQDVYRHARAAMCEAEAIEEVVGRLKAEPQGLVRVSCPVGAERFLADQLPAFLMRHPKLRVQLVVSNRRIDLIEEGVDIAIRFQDKLDASPDLQVKIVANVDEMLVASPSLVSEHGLPATPSDLPCFPTLSHTDTPGPDRWTLANAKGEETTVQLEPRLAASSFPVLRRATIEGLGVAKLPEYGCRELIAAGQLVRVLPEWTAPRVILHLVFTTRRGLLPSVRAVIDFAAKVLEPGSEVWRRVA